MKMNKRKFMKSGKRFYKKETGRSSRKDFTIFTVRQGKESKIFEFWKGWGILYSHENFVEETAAFEFCIKHPDANMEILEDLEYLLIHGVKNDDGDTVFPSLARYIEKKFGAKLVFDKNYNAKYVRCS